LTPRKVLVVEDEEHERTGLCLLVTDWGYSTRDAVDGIDALTVIEEWLPSIIVADLKMPRMGAFKLFEHIQERSPTLPFIIVTAQGTIDTAVQAMRMGVYDYLTKPIDTNRLRRVLDSASTLLDKRAGDTSPLWEGFDGDLIYYPEIVQVAIDFGRVLSDARRNPLELLQLNPRQFEELVAEIWRRFGYITELTTHTRDGGRDVIALKNSEANVRFLIECKRYDVRRKVSIGIVRQLYGVKTHERATMGILATTSTFTATANKFFSEHRWELEARDYNGVVEWVKSATQTKPSEPRVRLYPG
jgi:YesN/AraC family two-component response regulator